MASRSPCGATATGPAVRMHPDRASAVMIAVIENRNARATRTGAIPQSETALVLHRLWLTKGFFGCLNGIQRRQTIRHCEEGSDEAIHSIPARRNGLLRGACHRARIRATRWL